MATKNWNNDFMAKVLEEAAWKELSSEFAWNEPHGKNCQASLPGMSNCWKSTRTKWRGKRFPTTATSFGLYP